MSNTYTRFIRGPQGDAGFVGNAGPQGTAGGQGRIGDRGNSGFDGLESNSGNQGRSDAGVQGTQGLEGDIGTSASLRGSQGIQGLQSVGAQGTQGLQGLQGIQNPTGFEGNQGSQGNQSGKGIQGFINNAGVQGSQGSQGPQGNQGSTGQTGMLADSGAQGVGIQGVQGVFGPQGYSTGLRGSQGRQGSQGAQNSSIAGNTGRQGPQGLLINYQDYFEVYDDFTGTSLDTTKWLLKQQSGTGGSTSIKSDAFEGTIVLEQVGSGIVALAPTTSDGYNEGHIALDGTILTVNAKVISCTGLTEIMIGLIAAPTSTTDWSADGVFRVVFRYTNSSGWFCESTLDLPIDSDTFSNGSESLDSFQITIDNDAVCKFNGQVVGTYSIDDLLYGSGYNAVVAINGTYGKIAINSFHLRTDRL